MRDRELACRTTWGSDLWEAEAEDQAGSHAWRPPQGEYDIPGSLPLSLLDYLQQINGELGN